MSAPKPTDQRQWQEAQRWLARADDDLRAAEALLALEPPILGPAAFHCQQAAEKLAKAVLTAVRQPPPRMHDVTELARRVEPHWPEAGSTLSDLGGITRWYVSARYPDAGFDGEPDESDVRSVLTSLCDLRRSVAALGPTAGGR